VSESEEIIEARIATRLAALSAGAPGGSALPPAAYLRRHLVEHAAVGNLLGDVLDPSFMPYVDAVRLRSAIAEHGLSGWENEHFRVWRRVAHRWNYERPASNAVLLHLSRVNAGLLSAEQPALGAWTAWWARWQPDAAEVIGRHNDIVASVAVAALADRPVVVSGSRDQTVRIWDPAVGLEVRTPLTGHRGPVTAVAAATVDGTPIVVSGSRDRTVRLWNLASGRLTAVLAGHRDAVTALAIATVDGRQVCVSGSEDETLRLWDLALGQQVGSPLREGNGRIASIAVGIVDGRSLAVVGSGNSTVQVWDLETGSRTGPPLAVRAPHATPTQTGPHDGQPTPVAIAIIGNRPIALAGTPENTVAQWDLRTGESAGPDLIGHESVVTDVAPLPDAEPVVVTGSRDLTVRLWSLTTGRQIGDPLPGHTNPVTTLAPLTGTPVLITGAEDKTVRAWDIGSGEQGSAPHPATPEPLDAVVTSAVGDTVVMITGDRAGAVVSRDLANGDRPAVIIRHDRPVTALATTVLKGRPVVLSGSADRTVRAADVATGEPVGRVCGGHLVRLTAIAATVVDDRLIAVACDYSTRPRLWDMESGHQINELVGHDSIVTSVAITRMGSRQVVVTGSADKTVRVWDLADGTLVTAPLKGHRGHVQALAVGTVAGSPMVLSGSRDVSETGIVTGEVRLWSLGEVPVGQSLGSHAGAVTTVSTIAAGDRLFAVTCGQDDLLRLWDVVAASPVDEPLPVIGAVRAVATTDLPPGFVALVGDGVSVVQLDHTFVR
jgi:WD40 repeat protein